MDQCSRILAFYESGMPIRDRSITSLWSKTRDRTITRCDGRCRMPGDRKGGKRFRLRLSYRRCLQCPYKHSSEIEKAAWSEWVESVRKDVEGTFEI